MKYGKPLTNIQKAEMEKDGADVVDPYCALRKQMKDCFFQVNADITKNVPNCQFSGTTVSIVLARGP